VKVGETWVEGLVDEEDDLGDVLEYNEYGSNSKD